MARARTHTHTHSLNAIKWTNRHIHKRKTTKTRHASTLNYSLALKFYGVDLWVYRSWNISITLACVLWYVQHMLFGGECISFLLFSQFMLFFIGPAACFLTWMKWSSVVSSPPSGVKNIGARFSVIVTDVCPDMRAKEGWGAKWQLLVARRWICWRRRWSSYYSPREGHSCWWIICVLIFMNCLLYIYTTANVFTPCFRMSLVLSFVGGREPEGFQ